MPVSAGSGFPSGGCPLSADRARGRHTLYRDVGAERRRRARHVGGVSAQRLEAALSAFEPDVEWDGTNLPDGKIAHGLDAIVEHLTKWAELWEIWEVELEQVIDAHCDQVIVFIRERGRTTAGLEVNERHSELYTVRNGKIAYRKGFSDADEALNAAGLLQ